MNSAVKLMPKTLLRSASRLACLAGLLLSASSYGQAVWTAESGIRIVDATVDPQFPNQDLPGRGNPYGLEINVGGAVPGGSAVRSENRVQRVGVRLQNLSHSYFADLDILLSGPGSRNILLMSDVALNQGTQGSGSSTAVPGGVSISRIQIEPSGLGTIDDFPAGISPVISATKKYRPRDIDGGDGRDSNNNTIAHENFPTLPAGPYSLDLTQFRGVDPKDSKWKLFVLDDRRLDDGEMGPWQLLLWLDPYPEVEGKSPGQIFEIDEMVEDTVREFTITIADPDSVDADIHFSIDVNEADRSKQGIKWYPNGVPSDRSGYSYRKDGNTWKLALKPGINQNTETAYDVRVKVWDKRGTGTADDGDGARKPDGWTTLGQVDAATIRVKKLRAVNDAPTIGKLLRINKKSDGSFERLEVSEISTDQNRLAGKADSSGLDAIAANEGNYAIEVNDVDINTGDLANLKIEGISSNGALIANTDIFTDGNSTLREIRLAPSGAAPNGLTGNSGAFTIVVKDPSGETASKNITFRVNTITDRHFRANPSPISLLPAASNPASSTVSISDISAQGRGAEIERMTVTLADISHRNPEEFAIVLRGPNNRAVTLMDGSGGTGGGSFALNKSRITFEDGKPQIGGGPIVQNGIRGETYAPKGGALPAGLSQGANAYNTLTEAFQGQQANGTWTLFAIDRLTGETGRIQGGFILTIWTRPVIASSDLPAVTEAIVFQEDAGDRSFTITSEDTDGRIRQTLVQETDSTGTALTEESARKLVLTDGSKTYLKGGDGSDKNSVVPDPVSHTFKLRPKGDIFGRTYVKITAWDAAPPTGDNPVNNFKKELLYTVDIRAVNGGPTITEILKQDVWLGQVVTGLEFTVTDLDEGAEAPNVLDVEAESDNVQLLPRANIKLIPGPLSGDRKSQTYQISLFPAAGEVGEANIRIRVTDKGQKNSILGEIPDPDPAPNTKKSAETILRFTVKGSPSRTVAVLNSIRMSDSATATGPTPGTPFPSLTPDVKDLSGVISSVKVNIYGMEATRPSDVVMALVKGNRAVLLMRDQGGSSLVQDVQLRFDDGKPVMPGTLTSGEWRPVNANGFILGSVMPAIAGSPTHWDNIEVFPTFRDAFQNQSPNGVWALYVADDTPNDPANNRITSWLLTIETKPDVANIDRIEVSEGKEHTIEIDVGDPQPGVRFSIVLTHTDATEGTLIESYTIDPSDIGDKRRIKIKTAANIPRLERTATSRVTVTVTNPQGDSDFDQFDLVALQENDAPEVNGLPEKDGFKVLAGTVSPPLDFEIKDVETTIGDLAPTLKVTTGDAGTLPQENIKVAPKVGGTANQYTITILPVGSQNLAAPINVEVTDKGSTATTDGSDKKTTKKTFSYIAENGDRLAFSNPSQIQIVDRDRAIPYPVVISVPSANIRGVVGRVFATVNGLVHDFPDDITIVLESPSGRRVVLMSNAGGINPDNSIKNPVSLTFSPLATVDIPNTPVAGPLAPGTYRSRRYDPDIIMPGGVGSTVSLSDDLDSLLNASIAGNWFVYIYDDSVGDQGVIRNGISLAFETAPTVRFSEGTPVSERTFFDDSSIPEAVTRLVIEGNEDTDKFLDMTILDSDSEAKPSEITITAEATRNPDLIASLTWEGANNGIGRRLKIKPAANASGKAKIRLTLRDNPGGVLKFTTVYDFLVEIRAIDDPPQFTFEGLAWWNPVDKETPLFGPIIEDSDWQRIDVKVRDVDSELRPADDLVVTPSDSVILPSKPENLALEFPAVIPAGLNFTTFTILAKPAANQHGTNLQLILSMKDRTSSGRTNFYVPVLSQNDNPAFVPANYNFSNFVGNLAVKVGEIKSTPVFRVSDVETDVKDIEVRLTSTRDDIIPVSQMSVLANGDERIVNFRAVGNTSQNGIVIGVTLVDKNSPTAGQSVEKTFTVDVQGTIADSPRIFASTDTILVPASGSLGRSGPYPATITVPDGALIGDVAKVAVVLDGFTHQTPDDLDVLLMGPDGTTVVLMSDVGGTVDVANLRLEFDDNGTDLRDDGPLVSGRYKPSNFDSGTVDSWPDAAINGLGTSLSAFRGKSARGPWRLFIIDDASGEIGELAKGWSLQIVTTPVITRNGTPIKSLPIITVNEDRDPDSPVDTIISGIQVHDPDGLVPFNQLSLSYASSNGDVIPATGNNIAYDNALQTFQVRPAPHQFADPASDDNLPEVAITVSRGAGGPSWTTKVKVRVKPRNDDPIISRLVNAKISEGTTYRLRFQVEDNDFSPKDRLRISVTSGQDSIVANSGIRFAGTTVNVLENVEAGTFDVDITPRANVIGTAPITVSVIDNSTLANHAIPNGTVGSPNFPAVGEPDTFPTDRSDTGIFNLTIEARNDPPDIVAVSETIAAVAGARQTFEITVRDPDHTSADITVTGASSNQAYIRDSNISVALKTASNASGESKWTVAFTPELNIKGPTTITLTSKDKGDATDAEVVNITIGPSRARQYAITDRIIVTDFSTNQGRANPYPSTNTVSDLEGDVSFIRVELVGLSHGYPDDMDIILVSPSGTAVKLMSDMGGSTKLDKVNVFIADSGVAMPTLGPIATGTTYRPGNDEADVIPGNIPAGPFLTSMADFVGQRAKGDWKLYILDDTAQDSGELLGWTLSLETRPRIEFVNSPPDVTIPEDAPISIPFRLIDEGTVLGQQYTFEFTSSKANVVNAADLRVEANPKHPDYRVVGKPVLEAVGFADITLKVKGADYPNLVGQGAFRVTTTRVQDPPFITDIADQVITSGTLSVIQGFDYGDDETPKKDLGFRPTSSNPGLIPDSNIFDIGNRLFVIPLGTNTGTARITMTVRDAEGLGYTNAFNVVVSPALHSQFAASTSGSGAAPITIRDFDGAGGASQGRANPYPSTITVPNLGKGRVSRVSVALSKMSHGYPSDIDVLLVGPNGASVMLMSDAGGGLGLTNGWFEFSDAASDPMLANPSLALASGSYKPTNHDLGSDVFPADAPAQPSGGYRTGLNSAFAGIDPAGNWKLYILDDVTGDSGTLADWILNIFTDQPSVGAIASKVTDENQPITVGFRVEDANTPINSLDIRVVPEDPGLVQASRVTCVGNDCSVVLTPQPYRNGATQVTVSVRDENSEVKTSFALTVNAVNFAPEIVGLADAATPSNRTLELAFVVNDPDFEDLPESLKARAEVLQPLGSAQITGVGAARKLIFEPAGSQGGAEVRVTVSDAAGASTSVTINITIGPSYGLNIAPIDALSVAEDGTASVAIAVLGSDTGNISVEATADDTKLIQPIVVSGQGAVWLATIKPVANANGSAKITVTAKDEFGTGSREFDVTVLPVPDAPLVTRIPDQSTPANTPLRVPVAVADVDSDPTNFVYSATFSNAEVISGITFETSEGVTTAVIGVKADASGVSSVTITVEDETDLSDSETFALTVQAPLNAPPTIGAIADQTTTRNVPARVVLVVSDPDNAVASLLYTAEFTNSGLVRNVRFGIGNDDTVFATVNLVADQLGTSGITVFADDGRTKVARSFLLTVNEPPNEPPVFGAIEDQITVANKAVTIGLGITDPDTALPDIKFTATASNARVIDGVTFNATTTAVTATVNLVKDATGVSTVTITADDGKNKVSRIFAVAVNEAPAPLLAKPTITTNADGSRTFTITWENGGELEWADSAVGPWTKSGNTSGSYSEPVGVTSRVFRVRR